MKNSIILFIEQKHNLNPNEYDLGYENGKWLICPRNNENWDTWYGDKFVGELENEINEIFK